MTVSVFVPVHLTPSVCLSKWHQLLLFFLCDEKKKKSCAWNKNVKKKKKKHKIFKLDSAAAEKKDPSSTPRPLLPPHVSLLYPVRWGWHRASTSFPAQTFLIEAPEFLGSLYMCGVDRLLPRSVYWTVKPGGHRPTWAHSEAPHSHQRGTHFMKNNTNNVTRAQNTSFPAALQIKFWLYYSSYYSPSRMIAP